jgi:hypothetical protein
MPGYILRTVKKYEYKCIAMVATVSYFILMILNFKKFPTKKQVKPTISNDNEYEPEN